MALGNPAEWDNMMHMMLKHMSTFKNFAKLRILKCVFEGFTNKHQHLKGTKAMD